MDIDRFIDDGLSLTKLTYDSCIDKQHLLTYLGYYLVEKPWISSPYSTNFNKETFFGKAA